ncbi:hypothetical protein GCM10023194_69370 [Planotetraspora phitsanulokensis]|uniref:Uncharacterized protein n=1 Tax=Planotetraspora phitsanulokensis TaxID=575192 RepID=A0A8J3XJ59_9ACTN|nr:hypothetical protein Pph01_80870 [Planotetraspora phitsanulokensis]
MKTNPGGAVTLTTDLLAALADDVHTAVSRASRLAYAILDGTLIPIYRVADQKPYHLGKHDRHRVNIQFRADPVGRLVWDSRTARGGTRADCGPA